MVHHIDMADYDALDACHRKTVALLRELTKVSQALEDDALDTAVRQQASQIDRFFSVTSPLHHEEEENTVFPALLASGDAELVQAVLSLRQDHGWMERNWALLGPQMRAIAKGEGWIDPVELQRGVDVFAQLCIDHIALEETTIYPESKARWAQRVAQREPLPAV
jgi:hemerythrin-like domain-containing protein